MRPLPLLLNVHQCTPACLGCLLRTHLCRGPQWDKPLNGVTLPDLLHEHEPFLRLIIMFRDPVDRYYSAFHYYR
jgi:hypothetical protein